MHIVLYKASVNLIIKCAQFKSCGSECICTTCSLTLQFSSIFATWQNGPHFGVSSRSKYHEYVYQYIYMQHVGRTCFHFFHFRPKRLIWVLACWIFYLHIHVAKRIFTIWSNGDFQPAITILLCKWMNNISVIHFQFGGLQLDHILYFECITLQTGWQVNLHGFYRQQQKANQYRGAISGISPNWYTNIFVKLSLTLSN